MYLYIYVCILWVDMLWKLDILDCSYVNLCSFQLIADEMNELKNVPLRVQSTIFAFINAEEGNVNTQVKYKYLIILSLFTLHQCSSLTSG